MPLFVTQQTAKHIRTHQIRINQSFHFISIFVFSLSLPLALSLAISISIKCCWLKNNCISLKWKNAMPIARHLNSVVGWSISIMLWHDLFNYYSIRDFVFFFFFSSLFRQQYFGNNPFAKTHFDFGPMNKWIYIANANRMLLKSLIIMIRTEQKKKKHNRTG